MRSLLAATAVLMFLAAAGTSQAASIQFDATGTNTLDTAGFFGVNFLSGSGSIKSLTVDLSAESGAFFDLDGRANYLGSTEPVLSDLVGLGASDVSITRGGAVDGDDSHPSILTFSFLSGSFTAGDSLRFAVDTDYLAGDPAPGGSIGLTGLILRISLENGRFISGGLGSVSSASSVATLDAQAVPEPGTALLVASGLAIAAHARSRRRA